MRAITFRVSGEAHRASRHTEIGSPIPGFSKTRTPPAERNTLDLLRARRGLGYV